ncbi:nucleolar pre-ribosomal-associated protein 1-like [Scleropages formosus]|uniref:Nucleolar pre-ribosomal-associated protein 1-like n=1 Tax=Scleropages formosus TaxID=113540 RepID=A0A0P7YQ02_SCLFO|nr:nucleolar pre-ribosomal-associated protein 1-like [Scleropages formosus]
MPVGVMQKKRANEVSGESDVPAKRSKVADTEFNGTVFKSMLKEPTKASKGLERFVSVAKKLPCADLYDVVEGYITISMECADVFKLLEGEKHSENELMLIFQSLEMILLRTASDLSHFSMVGTTIVKKITSSYMKLLQSSLHSENHRFVRVCLCLLSSMVSQGADMAREVFSHFYFGKDLSGLARRRDKMGRPDVRMAYIQFALSFLISGDSSTISQVLDMKDFLPDILSTGLKEDRISVINLILSTLQTKVIWNKSISKTQKVRFFSPVVLAHFASLYKWNGIVDASSDESKTVENPEEDGKMVVRELVHKFLVDLCCSRKHGISFYDPSFGTAGRAGNIVLLQFLVGLKQATEDEFVADLVVSVLKANPDMLSRYFKESQYSFAPRAKSVWQENITLLKKIYEAQPEVSKAFRTCEFVPLPRLLAMVMVTSLPPVCNKAFFTQGLSVDNTVVKHATLSLVSFILRRALKNMEHCLDQSVWRSSEFYTPAMMEDLVQLYREALSKILPDVNSIVWNWQSLMKKKAEDEVKKGKKEGGKEQSPTLHEHGSDEPEVILLKALILKVLCLYQKVVPHLISQSPFDFSKLLKGVVTDRGMTEQVPPVLQHQVLQLALELPASKFSWFRVQDVSDTEKATSETSIFYLLLKMFVSSDKSHLKNATRMLILKVLKDSSVFEYTSHELDLWLTHLDHILSAQQETVVHFLERVLVRLMSNPYTYTDKAASLVQDAAHLQANPTGQEGDAASIPISHIDDVLDMVDVILDSSEGDMDQLAPSVSDDLILQTFPFSALVPAALEARNSLQTTNKAEKGVVAQYLAAVLSDVLHCQRDPLPLCLALQHYDNELQSLQPTVALDPAVVDFHRYYSHWIPLHMVMKAFYNQGPTAWVQDSFRQRTEEALSTLQMTDFPVAIKQVLLYLKTSVDNFSTFPKEGSAAALGVLMEVLKSLLNKLQSIKDSAEPLAVDSQSESDLFLPKDMGSGDHVSREKVALTVLRSIFTHPTLESWFLALELGTLPNHNLDPIRLKRMWSQLSKGTLALLQCSAPTLRELGSLELITGYLQAIQQAVLKELSQSQRKKGQQESWALKGLLALHEYMDVSCLREVASAMLLLPLERLVLDRAEGTELSVYGRAVLQVLSEGMSGCDRAPPLSQSQLRGLSSLLTSQPGGAAEDFLLQILQAEPACAVLLPADMFLHCLRGKSRSTAMAIGAIMLQNCPTHRLQFQLWCLEPSGLEEMASSVDYFLPLLNAYLGTTSLEDPAGAKGVRAAALRTLKEALFPMLTNAVLSDGAHDSLARCVEALSGLVRLAAEPADVPHLVGRLPEVLQRLDSSERWQLVDPIIDKLSESPEQLDLWRKAVLRAAFHWLNTAFRSNRLQESAFVEEEEAMLQRLQGLMISPEHVSVSDWNGFVKCGLKYRYRSKIFLDTLNSLLRRIYDTTEVPKDLIALSTMHMMTTNHSLFLPSMLDPRDELAGNLSSKEALVSLLLTLVQMCPSVCHVNHFLVLLGAYGATLCPTDQKLLLLLQEYERNDLSLADSQFLLWGPAAVEHHKARKSLGSSLWQQPSGEDLLALLNPSMMLNTMAHFPQQRRLTPQDLGTLYDPCFLLPLFSVMLKPESVVNCYKFVSSHALGVTVAALSSYDPKVRAAAYHVLGSFYHHLEAARFKEKRQLLYLMVTVQNGIRQENLRFPFLLTTYIGKVAQQMLRPEEHMYLVMNKFLLAHQYLDLKRVPGFFRLFFSSDTEHKTEREWILAMLKEGMMDRHCYKLCDQQGIFQVLMGFCTSPLCEESTQAQILEVLHQAAHNSKAAHELIKFHGLLLLCGALDLVHRLWFTVLGQKNQPSKCSSVESTKCLPLPLISEFLCVLTAFIRHLQSGVKSQQLSRFLQTLDLVLSHRRRVLSFCHQAGWTTVREQALSCKSALKLLHFWGILSHNGPLLATLQGLLGRHKVKELLGPVNQKGRAKGHFQRGRPRKKEHPEEPAGEGDGEKHNGPILRDCEPLLRSIITHTETTPEGTDPESNALAFQTIQLLLKWTLRSLASGTGDVYSGLSPFLQWVQTSVLPYQVAVKAILADEAVKQDLLRLYHQTCKYQIPGRVPAQIETLQFFTTVMVHLLEAQGIPDGPLHKTVLNTCFSSVEDDESKKEAGLLLLSLYIQELWSGADEPVLFLTHVRLMDGVRQKGPKKQNAACAATAMCKAIAAAVGSVD